MNPFPFQLMDERNFLRFDLSPKRVPTFSWTACPALCRDPSSKKNLYRDRSARKSSKQSKTVARRNFFHFNDFSALTGPTLTSYIRRKRTPQRTLFRKGRKWEAHYSSPATALNTVPSKSYYRFSARTGTDQILKIFGQ